MRLGRMESSVPRQACRTARVSWICAVAFVACCGCGEATEVRKQRASDSTTADTWDVVYIGAAKAGSVHTVSEPVADSDPPTIRTRSWTVLKMSRYGEDVEVGIDLQCLETATGEVRAIRYRTVSGSSQVVIEGQCRDGQLHLVTTSEGEKTSTTMDWNDEDGGFFAAEQSLERQPMQPGEKRILKLLFPLLGGVQVATVTLQADRIEDVSLLDGNRKLLKIGQSVLIGAHPIGATVWTNAQGVVLKSCVPGINQTAYRTTQQRALAEEREGKFDLGWDTIVRVSTPLPRPHATRRIVYRAELPGQNPSQVFRSGISQHVQLTGDHTARITVEAVRPDIPKVVPRLTPPTPGDKESSNLIQVNDVVIQQMASRIVGSETDPWKICTTIERSVRDLIRNKNFSQVLATAAHVARSLEGDCTEHAVLLAALCRARGVPARVVVGLVYSPADQGFAFHMWNEVWVNARWIPLDATLGAGGIGAAHLKLEHSNLSQESDQTAILSVLSVMNQLRLDIVQIDR